MAKKLQNVKALKEMLSGTHRRQTNKSFYFGDPEKAAEKNKKRAVGEIWTETDSSSGEEVTWEQKAGFRIKHSKLQAARDYLHTFQNCPKETCTCTSPCAADKKMKTVHGMCLDCVIDMEHKLKIKGKYEDYEKKKMTENVKSFFKQTDEEVKVIKDALKEKTQFVNSDGSMEEWDMPDKEVIFKKLDKDYKKLKKNIFKQYEVTKNKKGKKK